MNSNCFYYGLLLIVIIFLFIGNSIKRTSIYEKGDHNFLMKVKKITIDEEKLKLELIGEEDLIGNYYFKSDEEKEYFGKNLKYGDLVYLEGNLSIPNKNTVPKAFNYREYLKNKGIYYNLTIKKIEIREHDNSFIYGLKNKINKRIENVDYKGYMKAFILGDKSDRADSSYSNYQSSGIAQLFALSGMHSGLLSNLLYKLLKKWRNVWKDILIDLLLIIYGFLVLFPFSILRCIIFFVLNSLNKMFNFELKQFHILVMTFSIICLLNHKAIYDVGFWYSFCTVGGIIISKEFINDKNKVKQVFKLSLITFLFSLPISLFNYYEISVLSVLFNIIFIPIISMFIYPLSLITFCFSFTKSLFVFSINSFEAVSAMLASYKTLSLYLSFNFFEIIIWYLLLLFIIKYKHYYLSIIFVLIVLFDLLIPYFDGSYYVNFFDVGQGDASLFISNNRKDIVLIDTGGIANSNYFVSNNYISYMKSLGIRKIDTVILTHGDYDHIGDALNILKNFRVEKVIFNVGEDDELERSIIEYLKEKKIPYYKNISSLEFGKSRMQLLNSGIFDDENENSNVVYLSVNNYKFLLMGDAGIKREQDLLRRYSIQNIDVLKVGHHGSKTSSDKKFIDSIEPKYSIISVGKNNRYGHPNKGVLNNLQDSKIFRTDQDGSIIFKIKNKGLEIETCSP